MAGTSITHKYKYGGNKRFITRTDKKDEVYILVNDVERDFDMDGKYAVVGGLLNIGDVVTVRVAYIYIPIVKNTMSKTEIESAIQTSDNYTDTEISNSLENYDTSTEVDEKIANSGGGSGSSDGTLSDILLTNDIEFTSNGGSNIGTYGKKGAKIYMNAADFGSLNITGYSYFRSFVKFYKTINPITDNTVDIGGGSLRYKDIYAANGTIQTSDRNRKKDIEDLDDNLVIAIFDRLRPVQFKMINGQRIHYGFIAQEIEDIHLELGIDIAWLIKTPEMEELEIKNSDGKVIDIEYKEKIDGEIYYGLRYEEFVSLQARYSQLMKLEINDIKSRLLALENK